MPENVTHTRGYLRFIRSKQGGKFSEQEVAALVAKLEELKLKRGLRTSLKHKANIRELVAEKKPSEAIWRGLSQMWGRVSRSTGKAW